MRGKGGAKESIGKPKGPKASHNATQAQSAIGISEGCRVSVGERKAVARLYCLMIARQEGCSVQFFSVSRKPIFVDDHNAAGCFLRILHQHVYVWVPLNSVGRRNPLF